MDFKHYVTQWFDNCYSFIPRQFYCQIHITRACEYHCAHCYFNEIHEGANTRLSLLDVKNILDRTKAEATKLGLKPIVDFTGGDPLLHADFFPMAEYARDLGIPFGIKGNPDKLRDSAQWLKELNIRSITLSLEGLGPYNDGIRGKGSFNKTIDTLGFLKDAGFIVRVHTTVSKFNSSQLIPLLNFFLENQFVIDNWTWSRFWSDTDSADLLSRSQMFSLMNELIDIYKGQFCNSSFFFRNANGDLVPRVFMGFKEHLWYPFLAQRGYIDKQVVEKINNLPNSINCTATKHVYIIDADGQVYKCRKIVQSAIGNILTTSFDELINTATCQKYMCLNANSLCGNCRYFNGCGGCAAIAEAKRKSFGAGDPDCFIKDMPSSLMSEFELPDEK